MRATHLIGREHFMRAIRVNDSITMEHDVEVDGSGARRVAEELNVSLDDVVTIGAQFAGQHLPEGEPVDRGKAIGLTTTAYTLGVMSALRANRLFRGDTS